MAYQGLYLPEIPEYRNPDHKTDPFIRFAKPDVKILFPHVQFPEMKEYKHEKRPVVLDPISSILDKFDKEPDPNIKPTCDPVTFKKLQHEEKMAKHKKELEELIKNYHPEENPKATKKGYKTLIIANLAYDVDDECLMNYCKRMGEVTQAVVIRDKEGKSRGYGFVEYEREKDFSRAYRSLNDTTLHGRSIVVDVERARTSPNWLPRRLGGGRGHTRFTKESLHHTRAYKKKVMKRKLQRERERERRERRRREERPMERRRSGRDYDDYRRRDRDYYRR